MLLTKFRQVLVVTSQHIQQGPFDSLASPLETANVFYLALKIGAENSLSQFCLTITKRFLLSISSKLLTIEVSASQASLVS